jgi:alanine racemase
MGENYLISQSRSRRDSQLSTHKLRSWIEIDLSAFRHNYLALTGFLPADTAVMQIVKADAYGHGALEIARTAIESGAGALGVANADEGALLRYNGFDLPILILSPALICEIPLIIENNLTPAVSDPLFARILADSVDHEFPVHLNIDTGMGRSGINLSEARQLYELCRNLPNLFIEGIFTHFAAAENDHDFTCEQITLFERFLAELPQIPRYIHSANSSAVLNKPLPTGNLVRLGALSYGFYTDNLQKKKIDLKPVLSFKSQILQIKSAQAGDYIGYNRTYCCDRDTRYAVIPVGYADGYDFLLGNKAKVLAGNSLCPVIGKVSMDMIAIDISKAEIIEYGDEVLLVGAVPKLRVEEVAALYGGSPYELLCQTGRRAPRFYFDKGELVSSAPLLRREFVSFDYNNSKLNTIIEAAVRQRLQSREIASFVFDDLLKNIFSDQDNNIFFRRNFVHNITFRLPDSDDMADYFITDTTLSYQKKLTSTSFRIACADNEESLAQYFKANDVEYRWLLDTRLKLSPDTFKLVSAKINDIELYSSIKLVNNCLEITCYNEKLNSLIGTEVEYTINTKTWYPQDYHQLTVYISGITQGFALNFKYPQCLKIENIIPILAGKNKFPDVRQRHCSAEISSPHWLFPSSGIVFVYNRET